ncbi:hypothetical protein P8452_59680 [Trifolium repens]|nr:hypothetical protein P8452_59680 [Trifolium repens]
MRSILKQLISLFFVLNLCKLKNKNEKLTETTHVNLFSFFRLPLDKESPYKTRRAVERQKYPHLTELKGIVLVTE